MGGEYPDAEVFDVGDEWGSPPRGSGTGSRDDCYAGGEGLAA
jgi:hypothetical protein